MLLTLLVRRALRHDREAGAALAGVVGILAATAIIAMTLLAIAVFGTGYTSASRAALQAHAAAEGGIEYARANPAACDATTGAVVSPAGSVPAFRVQLSYRTKRGATWISGCPPVDAVEHRLVSTGTAAALGAAGHSRGDTRTVEAVYAYEFPFLTLGDRDITITGSLTVHDTNARPADMSTNAVFTCGGGFSISGVLYVAGTVSGCSGKTVSASFVPTQAPHAFPRLTPSDSRWPRTPAQLVPTGTCTVGHTQLTLSRSTVECSSGLKLQGVGVILHGDVVIFAPQIDLDDVTVTSVGGRFSLYFVKPWPTGQASCPTADAAPDVTAKKLVTDSLSSVMLYSSTEIQLDSPEGTPVRAQLYGCHVDTKGSPKLALAPTGPLVVHSKRDVTG